MSIFGKLLAGYGTSLNVCKCLLIYLYVYLLCNFHHLLNNVANVRFMGLDGFGQFKLDEGTLQVVFGVFHFEVHIPGEMISKKADTQLEGK